MYDIRDKRNDECEQGLEIRYLDGTRLRQARKSDLSVAQPSHAHDCTGGDASFMIRHKGKARQRVVQETSAEEWRHTLEGSFSQVE